MIVMCPARIPGSCGRARILAWAPSKEVLVRNNIGFLGPGLQIEVTNRLCIGHVPTHKSNSVAVIDTSVDQVIAVIPEVCEILCDEWTGVSCPSGLGYIE